MAYLCEIAGIPMVVFLSLKNDEFSFTLISSMFNSIINGRKR